jgi:hypothetical protein
MNRTVDEEEEFVQEQVRIKAASDWGTLLKSNRQRVLVVGWCTLKPLP